MWVTSFHFHLGNPSKEFSFSAGSLQGQNEHGQNEHVQKGASMSKPKLSLEQKPVNGCSFGLYVAHLKITTENYDIQGPMCVLFAFMVQFCELRKVENNLSRNYIILLGEHWVVQASKLISYGWSFKNLDRSKWKTGGQESREWPGW